MSCTLLPNEKLNNGGGDIICPPPKSNFIPTEAPTPKLDAKNKPIVAINTTGTANLTNTGIVSWNINESSQSNSFNDENEKLSNVPVLRSVSFVSPLEVGSFMFNNKGSVPSLSTSLKA
jgi:hypothetical protein